MIRREPTKKGDKVKIIFELPLDDEDGVFLVGDFNAWSEAATPLRRRGGVRTASVVLVAGRRYAFRYYQAGKWFNDEDVDEFEPNEFGETNGIIDLRAET
jgi:1,4-alpha-glucan branching enzyme